MRCATRVFKSIWLQPLLASSLETLLFYNLIVKFDRAFVLVPQSRNTIITTSLLFSSSFPILHHFSPHPTSCPPPRPNHHCRRPNSQPPSPPAPPAKPPAASASSTSPPAPSSLSLPTRSRSTPPSSTAATTSKPTRPAPIFASTSSPFSKTSPAPSSPSTTPVWSSSPRLLERSYRAPVMPLPSSLEIFVSTWLGFVFSRGFPYGEYFHVPRILRFAATPFLISHLSRSNLR